VLFAKISRYAGNHTRGARILKWSKTKYGACKPFSVASA